MKLSRYDHSLIAWLLAASLLFNLLACGIAHGQLSGLQLGGIGGQFCSISTGAPPADGDDPSRPSGSVWSANFSCPLCAGVALSVLALSALSWLSLAGGATLSSGARRSALPPRFFWPAASPRAPPALNAV
ncbi:MAG: DUF2946 family protein [Pseudomonas sp.]|nr:DUF2946 family protein [Pseudomonas sp.]